MQINFYKLWTFNQLRHRIGVLGGNMIIKSIKMENFRSHRNSCIEFNKGITTIIGQNGSGKSSIFEAMNFALFAPRRKSKGFTLENLKKIGAKSFSVQLEFEVRGNTYKVVRKRHSGKSEDKLYINGRLSAESTSEINKKVEEILEIDDDVFSNAIYIKQGEISSLIHIEPAKRKEIIGKLLGIEKYGAVYNQMGEIIRTFENKLVELEGELKQIDGIKNEIDEIRVKIIEREKDEKIIEEEKGALEKLKDEKYNLLKECETKKEKHNNLKNKIKELGSELKNIKSEINRLERDLKLVRYHNDIKNNNEKGYIRYIELEKEIKELSDKIRDYKQYYDLHSKLIGKLEGIEKDLNKNEEKLKDMLKDAENVVQNIGERNKIKKEINNTRRNQRFRESTNRRLVSIDLELRKFEDIKDKLKELENIEKELKKIEYHKNQLNETKKYYEEYLKVEKEFEILKSKKKDFENLAIKKEELEKELEKKKNDKKKLEAELKSFEEIGKKISLENKLQKELEDLEIKINELSKLGGEKESRIKQLQKSVAELERTQEICPVCQSEITEDKKNELLSQYKIELEEEKESLKNIEKKLEKYLQQKEAINKELNQLNDLKKIYGGLKEKNNYLQEINNNIKEICSKLEEVEKELEKYKDLPKELENIVKNMDNLKEKHDKYIYSLACLKDSDEKQLLSEKNKILSIVGSHTINTINEKKVELEKTKDNLKTILRLMDEQDRLTYELKEIKDKIYSILGFVEQYKEWEHQKIKSEKEKENHKESYENYKNSIAILENYSKSYKIPIPELENAIDKMLKEKTLERETKKTKINELMEEIQNLSYIPEKHLEMKSEYEKTYQKLTEKEKALEVIKSEIKLSHERIKSLENKLKELDEKKKEKDKLAEFKNHLERIRNEVFSKNGFQRYLREKYIPLIQRYANEIFEDFELPYSHIQLTEDYSLVVDGLPVKSLSGGEQIAVALALRLGIAKAVCNNVECIILDEPTAYLDEERRRNLINIFRNIKTISQMIIITHHQELEQVADNMIIIKKEGEDSKIISQ